MRGRAAGGKTAATALSVNIAVSATDQAAMRVASDTSVETVLTEPARAMIRSVPFVNTNSV